MNVSAVLSWLINSFVIYIVCRTGLSSRDSVLRIMSEKGKKITQRECPTAFVILRWVRVCYSNLYLVIQARHSESKKRKYFKALHFTFGYSSSRWEGLTGTRLFVSCQVTIYTLLQYSMLQKAIYDDSWRRQCTGSHQVNGEHKEMYGEFMQYPGYVLKCAMQVCSYPFNCLSVSYVFLVIQQ